MALDEKEAVQKVLRRAEISRITRHLKNRLALASFKTKRGWEDLAFDSIEEEMVKDISNNGNNDGYTSPNKLTGSGTSSGILQEPQSANRHHNALYYPSFSSPPNQHNNEFLEPSVQLTRKRARTVGDPWDVHRTEISTKIQQQHQQQHPHQQQHNRSSPPVPPKTPPRPDKDGANLLMYLATSPSPAQRATFGSGRMPRTPQQPFNFTDYLNIVTPSPAGLGGGHGSPIDTPKSTRRRLFDD